MKASAIATLLVVVCASSVTHAQVASLDVSVLGAPADPVLSWTVSPGTYQSGVWTIPGTTTLTAQITDESGVPITTGALYWQTCTDLHTLEGLPSSECAQSGSAKWQWQVWINPGGTPPIAIHPCMCAGDQVGFRLLYRAKGSGFSNATSEPFDLFAETSCPTRPDCP